MLGAEGLVGVCCWGFLGLRVPVVVGGFSESKRRGTVHRRWKSPGKKARKRRSVRRIVVVGEIDVEFERCFACAFDGGGVDVDVVDGIEFGF